MSTISETASDILIRSLGVNAEICIYKTGIKCKD